MTAERGTALAGVADLLGLWLSERLGSDNRRWLDDRIDNVLGAGGWRELHITLGMIPRRLGRDDLALDAGALDAAGSARMGWDPSRWSIDAAARTLVLVRLAQYRVERFGELFRDLCRSADLNESLALYQGTAVFPHDSLVDEQIAEGLRTNIRVVFEAIAHRNPLPREQFDENRWNHMVLKALFIDSTLEPIQGLEERANAELARILCDYAHERWAAGRPVSFELWRCVGPFAHGAMIDDLQRAAACGDDTERRAAVLALSASPDPAARHVLDHYPEHLRQLARQEFSWGSLAGEAQGPRRE